MSKEYALFNVLVYFVFRSLQCNVKKMQILSTFISIFIGS